MPVVRPSGDVKEPVSIRIRAQEDRGPQTHTCEAAVGMGGISSEDAGAETLRRGQSPRVLPLENIRGD